MKTLVNVSMVLFAGMLVMSCTNKEVESRIAKLEGKVAELETKNGVRTTTPAATPVQNVPEVQPAGPLPTIAFTDESFDFGTINEGDVVDHVFKFVNTGDAPLIISSATASCGCTVPVWPRDPIAVGAESEIKVQFNSTNKPGIQNKTITITANTYPKVSRLQIKANVTKKDPA